MYVYTQYCMYVYIICINVSVAGPSAVQLPSCFFASNMTAVTTAISEAAETAIFNCGAL